MPLYDFQCRACGHEFEALVLKGNTPECPACHGQDLDRLFSSFAVSSSERTKAAATAKRKKEATTARGDNAAMEREIEQHRLDDH